MVYIYPRGKKCQRWIIYAKHKYFGRFCSRRGAEIYRDMLIDKGVLTPRTKNPNRYIYKTTYGKYAIQKTINGEQNYFGAYWDLEVAREERDLLEKNGWEYTDEM